MFNDMSNFEMIKDIIIKNEKETTKDKDLQFDP